MTGLIGWLTMADYALAKEKATNEIVERLSRRNTATQNGSAMEEADLLIMSTRADESMRRISARVNL